MSKNWEKVGVIGVDAGICWIGDPCYILHTEKSPKSIGADWADFCRKLRDGMNTSFSHDSGHEGLGVVVSTGFGDGVYPVYVEKDKYGRVMEVRVSFVENEATDCVEDEFDDDEDEEGDE